ncbi:unnamed protein product [Closterium sp. NIES-65]|nr:unnamed protein product [Closterium sp. NIES-65]CAI5998917.1 unnamed protein product [Closterium sp. NIES-65]
MSWMKISSSSRRAVPTAPTTAGVAIAAAAVTGGAAAAAAGTAAAVAAAAVTAEAAAGVTATAAAAVIAAAVAAAPVTDAAAVAGAAAAVVASTRSRRCRPVAALSLPARLGSTSDPPLADLYPPALCNRKDGLSLFDLTSGASTAPTADADNTVRSQWATRDAAARLAVRSHLPSTERAHFSQYKSAKTLYDAVVARYSSPATAALSRLMLPYLFPDLAAFPTVADLITHLRTSDTRYRAALPAKFCAMNPPPMYITLYYIVTRLPDSLGSVKDHFLSVCPTTLTVDLLEERLLAAEQKIVAVGASRGEHRAPFFEGCSPSPLLPSVASATTVDFVATESVGAASAPSGRLRTGKGKGGKGAGGAGGGGGAGSGCWSLCLRPAYRRPHWSGVAIFDLDYDAILAAMYVVSTSDEGDCYLCVPPNPGTEAAALGAGEAAALGASASAAPGAGESALSGTTSAHSLHTFTLESGASCSFFQDRTTITLLSRPVAVSLADPSGG